MKVICGGIAFLFFSAANECCLSRVSPLSSPSSSSLLLCPLLSFHNCSSKRSPSLSSVSICSCLIPSLHRGLRSLIAAWQKPPFEELHSTFYSWLYVCVCLCVLVRLLCECVLTNVVNFSTRVISSADSWVNFDCDILSVSPLGSRCRSKLVWTNVEVYLLTEMVKEKTEAKLY